MEFSLSHLSATLGVGEFANFALGPREAGGGAQGLWRAQLGQHWHQALRRQVEQAATLSPAGTPSPAFEVPLGGRLCHQGWTIHLSGRIDQLAGPVLREIKTVTRPLPADETTLRTDYPAYFLQLATYVVLFRTAGAGSVPGNRAATIPGGSPRLPARFRAELVFVETSSGLTQTIALTPFDEALVFQQLDALVDFLQAQRRAAERRRALVFHPAFPVPRPGQETIQQELAAALVPPAGSALPSRVLLFEAPTGYGKTGCVLEFALGRLRAGGCDRLIWLTGKSTGQLQVRRTLRLMTKVSPDPEAGDPHVVPPAAPHSPGRPAAGSGLRVWQVRNKREHCVNGVYHCIRDACAYLAGGAERWPGSGLSRHYLDPDQPPDLDTLRSAGREAQICPYEITRAALAFNDVWIGDYNYVFAPDNRGLFADQPGFDPARTLLVIDEAHNLPARVADAYSHTARAAEARRLLEELDHQRAPAVLLLAVEAWTRRLAALSPCAALDTQVEADLHDLLGRLAELVATHPLDYAALGPRPSETLWQLPALHEFLADAGRRRLLWVPRAGELAFTCLEATAAIGDTLRLYGGVILLSATLTPFARTAEACGLAALPAAGSGSAAEPLAAGAFACSPAPEAPPPEVQVLPAVDPPRSGGGDPACSPPPGPADARPYAALRASAPWRDAAYDVAVDLRVDTTYRQRGSHYGTTAAAITTMQAATGGKSLAVFFPSYAYAETVQHTLEAGGSVLRVALQPRLPDLAAQTAWVEESLALADALFLVLGSSFTEGIDLLGGRVTHALVVGPALPEVNAVQQARMAADGEGGREAAFRRVYQIPGLQKVNQALGRLVRAPGQRAKVLLHCRRFAETSYATLLAPEYQSYREIASEAELQAWLTPPA